MSRTPWHSVCSPIPAPGLLRSMGSSPGSLQHDICSYKMLQMWQYWSSAASDSPSSDPHGPVTAVVKMIFLFKLVSSVLFLKHLLLITSHPPRVPSAMVRLAQTYGSLVLFLLCKSTSAHTAWNGSSSTPGAIEPLLLSQIHVGLPAGVQVSSLYDGRRIP